MTKVSPISWPPHLPMLAYEEILKSFPFRINRSKLPNSFRIMATHPICADLSATYDRESRGVHLRSNDVTIHFSPISRDRMKIETHKWCQSTWLVEPLQRMCILTYLCHDLTLTCPWPDLTCQILQIDLSRSKSICFKPASRGEHDSVILFSCLPYETSY